MSQTKIFDLNENSGYQISKMIVNVTKKGISGVICLLMHNGYQGILLLMFLSF